MVRWALVPGESLPADLSARTAEPGTLRVVSFDLSQWGGVTSAVTRVSLNNWEGQTCGLKSRSRQTGLCCTKCLHFWQKCAEGLAASVRTDSLHFLIAVQCYSNGSKLIQWFIFLKKILMLFGK